MKQFTSFVKKEARHILRDKRTVLFGMPVVMMLLFGFAIFVTEWGFEVCPDTLPNMSRYLAKYLHILDQVSLDVVFS